ncbi:biotin/lipoyl-containing protein, partial [Acinetobacter baumannii]
ILMTLEAMKMEYTIRAPKDGVIVDSYFQVGDQVKAGDELVEFQPAQDEVA